VYSISVEYHNINQIFVSFNISKCGYSLSTSNINIFIFIKFKEFSKGTRNFIWRPFYAIGFAHAKTYNFEHQNQV